MKRTALTASLLAFAISAFFQSMPVDAQVKDRIMGRERPNREAKQSEQQAPASETQYPNATRTSPESKSSDRNARKIQTAFDQLNEGETDKASDALSELDGNSRLSPYEQALVDQGLAQVAYERDDVAGAVARWQKAVDSDALPNDQHFSLMYQVAQLQLSEEQYEPALATLERWQRESGSTKAEALALKGNALYRLERYPEAITTIDQAIAASGDKVDPTLYELKMASYYDQEDYAGAAAALEQLVRARPQDVKNQINLAQMYIELEQNERALAVMQKVLSDGNLKETEHWRQYYQLLSYADKPADAAAAIIKGMESGALPADMATYKALGDNYYLAEQIDPAIDAYGKAAALSTDDGNADQQRGHLLAERERYAEARDALNAAFRKGKLTDEGTAYLLLGEAESELGNDAAARAAFQKALGYERSKSNAESWLKNL